MDRDLEISIIKVLYVFAWADGQLHEKEVSLIENLMHQIPQLTTLDKVRLRLFGEYPIEQDERTLLIDHLVHQLCGKSRDREVAINRIKALNQVDGIVSRAEKNILQDLETRTTWQAKLRRKIKNRFKEESYPLILTSREKDFDELMEIPEVKEFYDEMVRIDPRSIDLLEIQKTFYAAGMIGHFASQEIIEDREKIFHILKVYSTFRGPEQTLIIKMLEQKHVALPDLENTALQIASSFSPNEKQQFFKGLVQLTSYQTEDHQPMIEKLRAFSRFLLLADDFIEEELSTL